VRGLGIFRWAPLHLSSRIALAALPRLRVAQWGRLDLRHPNRRYRSEQNMVNLGFLDQRSPGRLSKSIT
jgi:hypothetical protein